MTSYTGYMGGSPLFIAGTQPPGLPSPMPISPSTNTSTSATYTYSPTGLLSSETATTQTSPPSCLPSATQPTQPPTPPAHPTPPSQKPRSTTSTTSFSWNTASSIPEMIGVNGYAYIYAGGLPTEQIGPNGSVLYYLQDRQGSTVALTDSSGQLVASYSYSPYGTLTCGPTMQPGNLPNQPLCHPAPPTPPAACPPPSQHSPAGPPPCLSRAIEANHFLYDGQYLDTTSGLYYLRARWYDPATGQFTSVDALVALTGEPYSYAGGNPVNGGDPLGVWWVTIYRWHLNEDQGLTLLDTLDVIAESSNPVQALVAALGALPVSDIIAAILGVFTILALGVQQEASNLFSQLLPALFLSMMANFFTPSYIGVNISLEWGAPGWWAPPLFVLTVAPNLPLANVSSSDVVAPNTRCSRPGDARLVSIA